MAWRVLNLNETAHAPGCLDALRGVAEVTTLPATPGTLARALPEHDAYLASLDVRLTRTLIERCPRLRAVATPSTGSDHIDCACLAERGIAFISLRDDPAMLERIPCTAELTWALLLAVTRRVPWSFASVCEGAWARDRFRGQRLAGLTLGVLGYGRLGRKVSGYGLAFGMRVLACDTAPVAVAAGVERVTFDTLLARSDVLSVHVHLTPENRGLLDRAALARMKPGAILLNTSRGGVVDEDALREALESGRLGGAGLDVLDGEPDFDPAAHPLVRYARTHDTVVITPHIGGATRAAQREAFTRTAEMLAAFLRDRATG
jgi:D-3-phosphoglycerate dehydrogenase / 2-oxoglutarate reductase